MSALVVLALVIPWLAVLAIDAHRHDVDGRLADWLAWQSGHLVNLFWNRWRPLGELGLWLGARLHRLARRLRGQGAPLMFDGLLTRDVQ